MRVLVLSRYGRLGPSSRVRFYQYLPYLTERGIAVDNAPLFGDRYVEELYGAGRRAASAVVGGYLGRLAKLRALKSYDLVWLEGELFPWLPAWGETALRALGVPVVVDYDDAIFHRYDLSPRRAARRLLAGKIDRVMRSAAMVVVGNEYLGERARGAGAARVEVIPSVVDLAQYPTGERPDVAGGPLTIGWIGSPNTAHYLTGILPALEELARSVDIRLVSVGSGPLRETSLATEIRAWSEESEAAEIQRFDVGIMPLADGPWERGKCGYKLVQYMAGRLPVVASDVGANRSIVVHGETGFLAGSEAEWVGSLSQLNSDVELRLRMGEAGRARAEEEFSVQANAPLLADLLIEAAKLGVPRRADGAQIRPRGGSLAPRRSP